MSPGRSFSFIPISSRMWGRIASCVGLAVPLMSAPPVEIGVFSLFHSQIFSVRSCSGAPIRVGGKILEGSQTVSITSPAHVSSPTGGPADFLLVIPGKIERCFHGRLTITGRDELNAIVEMDLETAVASVVFAELPPGTPDEALKAQAVIARSFLVASGPRHRGFQFCDTTHCQFLRGNPPRGSHAALAAELTAGLLLTYDGIVIAPAYSAACGGRTLALNTKAYPFQSIECEYCRRHPTDPVRGHRLGLCQVGASGMAAKGLGFREILNHYYPGTVVKDFSTR